MPLNGDAGKSMLIELPRSLIIANIKIIKKYYIHFFCQHFYFKLQINFKVFYKNVFLEYYLHDDDYNLIFYNFNIKYIS